MFPVRKYAHAHTHKHTNPSLARSLSLGRNFHVYLCPYRNIQSLNMPSMPVIKLETVLPWQRCLRHSPWWQPPASRCTHTWIHTPNTHTHTHRAGAWAGEISAHQIEAHWPAYCCFKAPINFPLISVYRWGQRERLQMPSQSNKRWKHLRPTLFAIFWPLQHTMNDCYGIPEKCHQILSKGGGFLRWPAWHLGHIVALHIRRSKIILLFSSSFCPLCSLFVGANFFSLILLLFLKQRCLQMTHLHQKIENVMLPEMCWEQLMNAEPCGAIEWFRLILFTRWTIHNNILFTSLHFFPQQIILNFTEFCTEWARRKLCFYVFMHHHWQHSSPISSGFVLLVIH